MHCHAFYAIHMCDFHVVASHICAYLIWLLNCLMPMFQIGKQQENEHFFLRRMQLSLPGEKKKKKTRDNQFKIKSVTMTLSSFGKKKKKKQLVL